MFAAGPQPRASAPSVRCRASTAIICRTSSRSSAPSVRCRTSTAIICAQCSLPDLNWEHLRAVFAAGAQPQSFGPVFAAGPQPRSSSPSVRCRASTAIIFAQCSLPDLNQQKECQERCQKACEIWQNECRKECQERCERECQKECQKMSEAIAVGCYLSQASLQTVARRRR